MSCATGTLNTHDAADVIEILAEFTDSAGADLDPPTVKCLVRDSGGTLHTFEYTTDANLEKLSAGHYKCSIQPIELKPTYPQGKWNYEWVAEDSLTAVQLRQAGAEPGAFLVRKSQVG